MSANTCPFCQTSIHDSAVVCPSCGAQSGYGQPGGSYTGGVVKTVFVFLFALFVAFLVFINAGPKTPGPILAIGYGFAGLFVLGGLSNMRKLATGPHWFRKVG